MPPDLLAVLVLVAFIASGYVLGLLSGYSIGVKETERRWSDAVAKAEYDRKYRS